MMLYHAKHKKKRKHALMFINFKKKKQQQGFIGEKFIIYPTF